MFMVDQLWMWVLSDETIITCSPLRWNSWLQDLNTENAQNTSIPPPLPHWVNIFGFIAFMAEKGRRRTLIPQDELNISQAITHYFQQTRRRPFASVYDLASHIATTCVDVFDQHQISEDFQFFDFFGTSIGDANDQATLLLRQFRDSIGDEVDFDIADDTKLLVEIDDIVDELNTLQLVLTDQKTVVDDMNRILATGNSVGQDVASSRPTASTRTLDSHLLRISHMKETALKASTSNNRFQLYHLMDLKQKQANWSEALSSRAQAKEAAKQGLTIVVFTIVTIIFLPITFIAAIFTIETDAFVGVTNESGQIPFSYAIKYIFGVGLTLSIPFIILALNLERITSLLRRTGSAIAHSFDTFDSSVAAPSPVWIFIIAMLVLVVVVWTSQLANGVKAALSVTLIVFTLALLAFMAMYSLVKVARSHFQSVTASDCTD
ncbi:hypothetical protein B0H63DRAFT_519190 [Podospora didyma]|uniref:Uncharacterized protein n=1 Tax=Podospora didyma TaxID=330526 RepID=A0AAE0NYI2_9PEZI|nr:hypothetical protein B0H63DRAFT_519190 [Podospora didyma]